MKFRQFLTLTTLAALLAACGGGGGGDGAPASAGPVVSTDTFQLKTAYVNYINDTSTHPFKISGVAAGYSATGSGTVTQTSVTNGTFEGVAVLQKTTTVTGSFVANGAPFSIASADTSYVDSNYLAKGWSGDEYAVVTSVAVIPNTAKVNDSGIWHTASRYTTSAKTTLLGTSEVSFALQADTAATALLKIIQVDRNTAGSIEMTATAAFRMTPAGALTRLSENAIASTTNLTLTY